MDSLRTLPFRTLRANTTAAFHKNVTPGPTRPQAEADENLCIFNREVARHHPASMIVDRSGTIGWSASMNSQQNVPATYTAAKIRKLSW